MWCSMEANVAQLTGVMVQLSGSYCGGIIGVLSTAFWKLMWGNDLEMLLVY